MIETIRLKIRKAQLTDAPFFLQLLNEDSYIKNIRDSLVRTEEDAKAFIQKAYLDNYARHGFGLYVLDLKDSGKSVGVCGFVKRDDLQFPDIGFALLESECGKGYIFESAKAVLEFGRGQFGMIKILAITTHENVKSANTLERLGFVFKGPILLSHTTKELKLFELT